MQAKDIQRFFYYVDRRSSDECWNWTGAVNRRGYGKTKVGGRAGKYWAAHRLSYLIHYNVDPGDYWVLHSCDNPACVNPAHLRLGTSLENNRETSAKGRYQNPTVKTPPRPKGRKKGLKPLEWRFWQKVDKRAPNECWNWTAKLDRDGYGRIGLGGRDGGMARAPRISYRLHYGVDPSDMMVCHTCNNPACVNPAHLYLGTYQDNNKYTVESGNWKNPGKRGMESKQSNLTDDDIREIRRRYADGGISQTELAKEYGIGQGAVSRIVLRKAWSHID